MTVLLECLTVLLEIIFYEPLSLIELTSLTAVLEGLYYFNVSRYLLSDLLSVFTNFIIIKIIIRDLIPSSDTFDNTKFNTNVQLDCFTMLCTNWHMTAFVKL